MRRNELRELLTEFEGRLHERFDQVVFEAALASMDTRRPTRVTDMSYGTTESSHSMTVQFEKSHAHMKLGLEAVQILDERTSRRFGEHGARLHEHTDLLKTVARR